ncbi:MAG: glycoside hydrolase family 2, partial [Prevotella sp.]|nr:glycoside hydrolase family 2 [Prevotella sp.]
MKKLGIILVGLILCGIMYAQEGRMTISLNGEWQFDQTLEAFPPAKYTRKIPVPGLVHLATPRIDQYEKFFKKPDNVELEEQFNFLNRDYIPKYNWYKKIIDIPAAMSGREAFISIKKSQYVTQVYVNGIDIGSSMECYTPVEFPISHALKFGGKNEIIIKVGDRAWLPSQAPGSIDKEKVHYLSGIWDDVEISFTGKQRVHKALLLPSVAEGKVTAKIMVRSLYPPQMLYADPMWDKCKVTIDIYEKKSGIKVARQTIEGSTKRDNNTVLVTEIPMTDIHKWTTDDPFLYKGVISIFDDQDRLSDTKEIRFGMRDFGKKGKHFTLNGEKIYLRGSNITLQRFFEDPDCGNLAWDREWVTKLMSEYPKQVNWNAMRICVGIVPDFWYDIADEAGIMLQNEWFYWQNHGWNDQTRQEFTSWVWNDGNHPSIVIWDAINENWDDYIGNVLVPELQELDPTRIWDTGYMTA